MMMKKDLGQSLKNERIHSLKLRRPLRFESDTPIERVVAQMEAERLGCVLVEKQGKLVGIFTERDALTRVVEPGIDLRTPLEKVMTAKPKTLQGENSVADAIRLMSGGGYRHVPIVGAEGKIEGVLSVKVLVNYLAEHFPYEVYNLPPDLHQVQRAREGA